MTGGFEAVDRNPCRICGSVPTASGRLGQETGLLVVRRVKVVEGALCRECGISLFREMTSRSLLTGWWGIISFFANVFTIGRNVLFRRRLGRLSAPTPMAGSQAAGVPLDPGKSLFARPLTWAAAAVVIALVVWIGVDVAEHRGRKTLGDLRVGDCVTEPSGDEFLDVKSVRCDEPHDLEVFLRFELIGGSYPDGSTIDNIVATQCWPALATYVGASTPPMGVGATLFLPAETAWRRGDRDAVCVVYDAAGVRLVGSLRGRGAGQSATPVSVTRRPAEGA